MENKNILISAVLILAVLSFVSTTNITGHVTEADCADSDQGRNSEIFGVCKSDGTNYKDACVGNKLLAERYCDSKGNCAAASIHCDTKCVEGVCIKEISVGEQTLHAQDIFSILNNIIKVKEITAAGSLVLEVNGVTDTLDVKEVKTIDNLKFESISADVLDKIQDRKVDVEILFQTYYLLRLDESLTIDKNVIKVKEIFPPEKVILEVNDEEYEIKDRLSRTINNLKITNRGMPSEEKVILNINRV